MSHVQGDLLVSLTGWCTADLEDGVGSVGADDGDDMQLLSGLTPQGLQGIHGTAISLQAEPTKN